MKYEELKSLTAEELKEKCVQEKSLLIKKKLAQVISQLKDPHQIKNTRRLIARIKTLENERSQNGK